MLSGGVFTLLDHKDVSQITGEVLSRHFLLAQGQNWFL